MEASELFDPASKTPIGSDLAEGLKAVALNQKIRFRLYGRVVLPLDGWVFWVRSDLLKQKPFQAAGLATAASLSAKTTDGPVTTSAQEDEEQTSFEATGSLHYTVDLRQEEAETYAANRVIFTSLEEVEDLNAVAPGTLWIGEIDGLRFAFSNLAMRYRQAGLWHYSGFAVYPDMKPQVIDDVTQFSTDQVVSNSLPAWLAIAAYRPAYASWGPLPTLFPSFLVPDNEAPPYASVHVLPEGTRALAASPTLDHVTSTHTQLCADHVRITLWGARNNMAMDFVDAVNQYSLDTGAIGIMNLPVVRDEKRTQAELGTLAAKKVIDFEVSYLQHRMNTITHQIIRKTVPNLFVDGKRVGPPKGKALTTDDGFAITTQDGQPITVEP